MGKLGDLTSKEMISEFIGKTVADYTLGLSGQRSIDNMNNHTEFEQKIREALSSRGINRITLNVNEFELTPESDAFIDSLDGKPYEDPNQPVPSDGYSYDSESSVVMFLDIDTNTTVPVRGHGKFTGKIVDAGLFGMEPTVGN